MMRSLFSAVSGLKTNQTAMDIIGNNIANVNTIGYKTSRTVFQDIFSQTISTATAATTTTGGQNAKQVGLGVGLATVGMNMTEGSTQSTSNPLDFALSGEGFLVVSDGNGGYYYTRNGALQLDQSGNLVTANGDYVMAVNGSGAAIDNTVTPTTASMAKIQMSGVVGTVTYADYAIDGNGVVTAVDQATGAKTELGRIVLATFPNTSGLEKAGSSYYIASSNSGTPAYNMAGNKCGTLKSGSLEMSNVDLSSELTNMIITQRGFQANSRVITTTDSMLEELINLKR